MERLFAPWRMAYILSGEEADGACIFCRFPAEGPQRHRERLILCASERAFVIMNKFPYNPGHLMVVPRTHAADPGDLSDDDYRATTDLVRAATAALRAALAPEGVNLGMNLGRAAGAGIDQHCHYHLVPRWNGDTNFMPLLAEVKVVPEHVASTYERLLPFFAGLPGCASPPPGPPR